MARWKPLVLALALLLFAAKAGDPWGAQIDKFQSILGLVRQHYPQPPDEKVLVDSSIRGLLASLDPHSYFLDSLSLRTLLEDQVGNFYGIGVRVSKFGDRLTVIAPLKGMPAERLGVLAGDIIAEIDGHPTKPMALEKAMTLLRGEKGTEVEIKVQREGSAALIPFRFKRERIPLQSLGNALVHPQDPRVGYVSLRVFGRRTAAELGAALEDFRRRGVTALILDLRGNPGGSFEAAVEVADLFLARGRVIVTSRSRRSSEVRKARKNDPYEDLPLVCLVNRSSASASEIVAAALQDHGRAQIVGQRTWGKGLVESVSTLSNDCALALTTATYVTPAGRTLQRDFSSPWEYYSFAYEEDYDTSDRVAGGVRPDVLVRPAVYSPLVFRIITRGLLFEFSRRLSGGGSPGAGEFVADERVLREFQKFLAEKEMALTAEEWEKHRSELQVEIERQVVSDRVSPDAGVGVFLKHDPVCQKALEILSSRLH